MNKHSLRNDFFFADLASGSSIDWVYATQNVPLTYTFELRDKGKLYPSIF